MSSVPPTSQPQQRQHIQLRHLDGKPVEPSEFRKVTELAFKLSRESEARITILGDASQEAIEKLAALLELQKDTFPTKAELEQPKEKKPRVDDEEVLPFPGYDRPLADEGAA